LMGRHLGNSLINLDLYEAIAQAVKESGLDLTEL
jgi:starch phosphorylase